MTLTCFALLWLLLGVACTLLGLVLTQRQRARQTSLPTAQLACPHCRVPRETGARFCGACGQRLRHPASRLLVAQRKG
jgi:hypothetical protein